MYELLEVPVVSVPPEDAGWPEMLDFALTYNGYTRIGSLDRLAKLSRPILGKIGSQGSVPEDVGLDLLRAVLFFRQRASHHSDDYGVSAERQFRALIDATRLRAGDSPLVRDLDAP